MGYSKRVNRRNNMGKFERRGDEISFRHSGDDFFAAISGGYYQFSWTVTSYKDGLLWIAGTAARKEKAQADLLEDLDSKILRLEEQLKELKGIRKTVKGLKGVVDVPF